MRKLKSLRGGSWKIILYSYSCNALYSKVSQIVSFKKNILETIYVKICKGFNTTMCMGSTFSKQLYGWYLFNTAVQVVTF